MRYLHQKLPGATTRDMADLEERLVMHVGTTVRDPLLNQDLRTLGWIHRRLVIRNNKSKSNVIQIMLQVPTLLHPYLEQLKDQVQVVAQGELTRWVCDKGLDIDQTLVPTVVVQVVAQKPVPWMIQTQQDQQEFESRMGPGLAQVAHFLAVYSCKGGVGKSTVAVNLAYELARMGGRVGLLDVDVYGPSLSILVQPEDPAVRPSPVGKGMIYPIQHEGVKLLSLAYVSPKSGVPGSGTTGEAAVLRGPMAGKVVSQLLKGTDWGELDVLILDLPPGTGDVQLTLCQDVEMSGAVAVTTPSKLAIADVQKGIEMFSSLGIPTLALVENMAYFECEGGGKHYPFGQGFQQSMKTSGSGSNIDINAENICQLPVSSLTNDANDGGNPLCLERPPAARRELDAFRDLALIVSRELIQSPYRSNSFQESQQGQVSFSEGKSEDERFDLVSIQLSADGHVLVVRAFSAEGALQKRIAGKDLRDRDPKTGEILLESSSESCSRDGRSGGMVSQTSSSKGSTKSTARDVARRIEKKANVGFEVFWGDGAKFIYSRRAIALAAGGTLV